MSREGKVVLSLDGGGQAAGRKGGLGFGVGIGEGSAGADLHPLSHCPPPPSDLTPPVGGQEVTCVWSPKLEASPGQGLR